ncbi:DUF167 domain-containing protein [Candidatus Micrarchaeota archaeon]|nr:DUF167 domain-containing protein [Candidatus Micrarchaeota archaeon]
MNIRVVPNAKRFSVAAFENGLKVWLRSPPTNERANRELLHELEKRSGARVRLIRGAQTRKKAVQFEGMSDEDAIQRIMIT